MYLVLMTVYLFSLYKYLYSFTQMNRVNSDRDFINKVGASVGLFSSNDGWFLYSSENFKAYFPTYIFIILTTTVFEFFFVTGLSVLLKSKQKFWHWPDAIFHFIKYKSIN